MSFVIDRNYDPFAIDFDYNPHESYVLSLKEQMVRINDLVTTVNKYSMCAVGDPIPGTNKKYTEKFVAYVENIEASIGNMYAFLDNPQILTTHNAFDALYFEIRDELKHIQHAIDNSDDYF